MSVKLRVTDYEHRTGVVEDGVRCGMVWCGVVLGALVSIAGVAHASLLEGFRREDWRLQTSPLCTAELQTRTSTQGFTPALDWCSPGWKVELWAWCADYPSKGTFTCTRKGEVRYASGDVPVV